MAIVEGIMYPTIAMTRSGGGDKFSEKLGLMLEIGDALEMIGCKHLDSDDTRCGYRRPLDGCAVVGMFHFR